MVHLFVFVCFALFPRIEKPRSECNWSYILLWKVRYGIWRRDTYTLKASKLNKLEVLEVLTHENTFERLKYLLTGSETMGHKNHLAGFEVYKNL